MDPTGLVTKKDLLIQYSAESEKAGRPVVPARTLYAAIRRLRPSLAESQRRIHGDPHDVFLGLSFRQDARQSVPIVSAVSASPNFIHNAGDRKKDEEGREAKDSKDGKIAYSAYTLYEPIEGLREAADAD